MVVRARKCVFIRFPANVKGYTLYDLHDGSIFVSRDVHFYEQHIPFKVGKVADSPDGDATYIFNPSL